MNVCDFRRVALPAIAVLLLGFLSGPGQAAEPARQLPGGITLEEPPSDPALARIVLVAGSSVYKPGEHEYLAGCVALADLLRQTPGVFPVLAVDWPEKPETLAGGQGRRHVLRRRRQACPAG